MVDMEDAERNSPKEGSKGSRRRSRRQVCRDKHSICCAVVPTDRLS